MALQGFLKRTRIRNETTYNLEFKLPCMSRLLSLPIEACDKEDALTIPLTRSKVPYSKVSTRASQPRTRVGWKPEDDTRLVDMKKSGCPWKDIYAAFPDKTPGTIHVLQSSKAVLLKATSLAPPPRTPVRRLRGRVLIPLPILTLLPLYGCSSGRSDGRESLSQPASYMEITG